MLGCVWQVSAHVSCCKAPDAASLPELWRDYMPAFLAVLQRATQGNTTSWSDVTYISSVQCIMCVLI